MLSKNGYHNWIDVAVMCILWIFSPLPASLNEFAHIVQGNHQPQSGFLKHIHTLYCH